MTRRKILLVANFSNQTGYAWNNIYSLFIDIANSSTKYGLGVCFSFAKLSEPHIILNYTLPKEVVEFDPFHFSFLSLINFLLFLQKNNIKWMYLTDNPPYHWKYALFRLFGVEKIIVHNRISVTDPQPATLDNSLRGHAKYLFARIPFWTADRMYAVSDFVRDRVILRNRFPAHKIHKILNGIDVDKFCPRNSDRLESDTPTIFVSGRATSDKGIPVLIKAAAQLKQREPHIKFKIQYAGDGPELSDFKRMVEENKLDRTFIFLGEVPSTESYLSQSDIVVVPSVWGDACPSSVSEALASAKPLIATTAGGIPEIVGDTQNAILVTPHSVDELATALRKLISNKALRDKLSINARNRAIAALDRARYIAEVIGSLEIDFGLKD